MPSSVDIAAIIVTYAPTIRLRQLAAALTPQVGAIFIINNNPDPAIIKEVQNVARELSCHFLQSERNNLGYAQNYGISQAQNYNFNWVILLDDDSLPAPNMVAKLAQAYEESLNKEKIAIIAPVIVDGNSARTIRYPLRQGFLNRQVMNPGGRRDDVMMVINSGSMMPISIFADIGPLDESYVIDYIDKEFCLRALRHGYCIVVDGDAQMTHHIGLSRDHHCMGQRFTTTNHSPTRRYYITRNRLRTFARYGFHFPAYALYEMLGIGYDLMRVMGFEVNKYAKLRAMLFGMLDALTGKTEPRMKL